MLSEPVKALFESNTNARHAGDADRLAKEHKPNGVHVLTDLPYGHSGPTAQIGPVSSGNTT